MFRRIVLSALVPFAVLVFAVSASAQLSRLGEVTDVIDGRTVVVANGNGRVTKFELQYIEVPGAGQELHDMVRAHLRSLVLGKVVDYRPKTLLDDRMIGWLIVNKIDVSQQMLRDGAAWLIPVAVSGQDKSEYDTYASMEAAAKQEKRGVWSIPGLRPAWEVRAEKRQNQKRSEQDLSTSTAPAAPLGPAATRKPGMWADKNPSLPNVGALLNGYNAATRTGYLGTSLLGVTEIDKDKANQQKTAIDIMYYYKEDDRKGRTGVFVVNVVSEAGKWRFLENNDLILMVEGKSIVIGKAKRKTEKDGYSLREHLAYEVHRSVIEKIANGAAVDLRIGDYLIRPSFGMQQLLYNMLEVSG